MPSAPVPTRPWPTLAPADPPAAASLGFSPWLLRALLISLLRRHFAAGDMVMDPVLRDLAWAPDPAVPGQTLATASIVIEDTLAFRPDLVGGRPGLFVAPASMALAQLGINNQVQNQVGPGGETYYVDRGSGTCQVLAIGAGASGGEGERLAWEAYRFLRAALPIVRERYSPQLARARVAGVGTTTNTIQEVQAHPASPVAVEFEVVNTWSAALEAPRLRRLVLDVTQQIT